MGATALITPRDLLLPAGARGVLEIEVERPFLTFVDPPIADAEVQVDGVGSAVTDRGGIARVALPELAPGAYRYPVRLVGGRRQAREAEAFVRVAEKDAPVFISDLDMTVARANALTFIFRSNESVQPFDGAAAAIEEVARTMVVVYLTARDHIFIPKTKAWLRLKGFPEGPLYARKVRFWSARSRTHKIGRLAELKEAFPNLRWGVGDRRGDIEAYAAHDIPAILLAARPPSGLPPGTRTAPDWPTLLHMLMIK